jgi:uncharacterized protein YvpB
MKHVLIMLLPVLLSMALSTSASTGIMHGRKLFKFQSKADFGGFRLSGARWDANASCVAFQSDGAQTDAGNSMPYGMLESPDIETGFPTNQMVLSWNADTPVGSFLKVYIQVRSCGLWSRRFAYAIWNRDNRPVQRMTVNGQSDDIAAMDTDTLISKVPLDAFRVSIELCSLDGKTHPTLRLLTAHCIDTKAADPPLRARKSVWGTELPVPERSQLTIPQGNRFCSATSTSMVLEYWGKKLNRPELNVPLQTAVDGIYDYEMGGTGNWPFNTAYAAEFGGLRAYVTRFASMSQIEDWIAKGVPVIVSMDYNILMHSKEARRMGHLMVFRGFTDKGDCIINDPYTKLDKGEHVRRIFNRKDFEASWLKEKGSRGTVYLIYPGSWGIPKNLYGNW